LPVSRLARRSIFILACALADPAIAESFAPEASCPAIASNSRPGYFRLEQQLPGGLSSSQLEERVLSTARSDFGLNSAFRQN
jgi:hypothetical protein